jgi:hypothetical protein
VFADPRTAPVDEKLRAALILLQTMATRDVTKDDIEAVRSAGVSDDAIEDAVTVSTIFHMIDRLADSFSFALPDEAGYAAGAKVLLRVGYGFPAPVWKLAARE